MSEAWPPLSLIIEIFSLGFHSLEIAIVNIGACVRCIMGIYIISKEMKVIRLNSSLMKFLLYWAQIIYCILLWVWLCLTFDMRFVVVVVSVVVRHSVTLFIFPSIENFSLYRYIKLYCFTFCTQSQNKRTYFLR